MSQNDIWVRINKTLQKIYSLQFCFSKVLQSHTRGSNIGGFHHRAHGSRRSVGLKSWPTACFFFFLWEKSKQGDIFWTEEHPRGEILHSTNQKPLFYFKANYNFTFLKPLHVAPLGLSIHFHFKSFILKYHPRVNAKTITFSRRGVEVRQPMEPVFILAGSLPWVILFYVVSLVSMFGIIGFTVFLITSWP